MTGRLKTTAREGGGLWAWVLTDAATPDSGLEELVGKQLHISAEMEDGGTAEVEGTVEEAHRSIELDGIYLVVGFAPGFTWNERGARLGPASVSVEMADPTVQSASVQVEKQTIEARLDAAFERFLRVYARFGGHRYHGWRGHDDPRSFRGPMFWSEGDCVYRLGLELEEEFPGCVHLELAVARWSFADYDKALDKREFVDLVVSDLSDFREDEISHQRFSTHQHELFVEGKLFPAGSSTVWRHAHLRKVASVSADAARLARHIERGHCTAAAVLVVDDDGLFEAEIEMSTRPSSVKLLLACEPGGA